MPGSRGYQDWVRDAGALPEDEEDQRTGLLRKEQGIPGNSGEDRAAPGCFPSWRMRALRERYGDSGRGAEGIRDSGCGKAMKKGTGSGSGTGGEASPDAVRFLPYRTGTEKRFFRKSAADAV